MPHPIPFRPRRKQLVRRRNARWRSHVTKLAAETIANRLRSSHFKDVRGRWHRGQVSREMTGDAQTQLSRPIGRPRLSTGDRPPLPRSSPSRAWQWDETFRPGQHSDTRSPSRCRSRRQNRVRILAFAHDLLEKADLLRDHLEWPAAVFASRLPDGDASPCALNRPDPRLW
jgi:hypothetical protein